MMQLQNPVLRGFNPDPSFLRVGDDYYLATSTFEWFPGAALYHSRDLVNWRMPGHGLTRKSQLNMTGIPDSGGIWAPALSMHDGVYYLVYTIVRNRVGAFTASAPESALAIFARADGTGLDQRHRAPRISSFAWP